MDLRNFIENEKQIKKAEELVFRGLLNYQPFILNETLQVGVGYEFLDGGEFSGMVYWPNIRKALMKNPLMKRLCIENDLKNQFIEANSKLRNMYNYFVSTICEYFGEIEQKSIAEVGCNSGYIPVSFSLKGAKEAVGYDREDYSETFSLLNDILNTRAQFIQSGYDGKSQTIPGSKNHDVIISMAVLCHLSDPLQHLACIGNMTSEAIFIWTPVTDDDDYCIRFGEPNKYYTEDTFPLCFDNVVRPSGKSLIKSLEIMGFTEIHEIPNIKNGMPDYFFNVHKAILAVRPKKKVFTGLDIPKRATMTKGYRIVHLIRESVRHLRYRSLSRKRK